MKRLWGETAWEPLFESLHWHRMSATNIQLLWITREIREIDGILGPNKLFSSLSNRLVR